MSKSVRYFAAVILSFSLLFLPGVTGALKVQAQEEAPSLKKIHPNVITAGTRTFTIRLDGRRFASDADVLFDGVPLASPRMSKNGKVLLAEVDASLIASPGTHTIQGVNPDGAGTATATLTVGPQDPNLQIRLEQNAVQEDAGVIFLPTIRTDSFKNGTEVLVWGRDGKPTEIPGGVQIEIPDDLVNDPASIPITLIDKNGNLSNTELFFVVPIPPEINEVDPASLVVGTEDVPLIVTGVFKAGAMIVVNDIPLATTVGKNQRLEATLPGALRSQPAQLILRVEQEGIQSLDTILPVTPTTEPFIFNISPVRIRQGENKTTIEVIGANFGKKVIAFVDGEEAAIKNSSRTRLTVVIKPDLALGVHTVAVQDPDGNITETSSFEVVPDVEVSTLAGAAKIGFDPGCISGAEAKFRRPRRLTFGPDGLLYVTDQQNHAIRTVNVDTGEVCTIAGTGEDGYHDSGNELGEPPTFSFPNGIAVDGTGTIFVTENGNSVIRRIRRSGASITVDTVAGLFREINDPEKQEIFNSTRQGIASYRDAGQFDSAFRTPDEMIIAPDGSIYVADAGNHAIRRVSLTAGGAVVETIAGNGVPGFADGEANRARFNTPTSLVLSDDGNFLFVADTNNNRIRRVDLANRRVSTVAGGATSGTTLDGPGGQAILVQPIGLALDSGGVLYVAELGVNDIRQIDALGNVTTLAGGAGPKLKDGPGLEARFNMPRGLAIDRQRGILYVADYENLVIRSIALR
jgi:sugar lactone lactonase YvrE/catechol 2,3-dioxygenase-like lactoylglutathione lyase family enzyme